MKNNKNEDIYIKILNNRNRICDSNLFQSFNRL